MDTHEYQGTTGCISSRSGLEGFQLFQATSSHSLLRLPLRPEVRECKSQEPTSPLAQAQLTVHRTLLEVGVVRVRALFFQVIPST